MVARAKGAVKCAGIREACAFRGLRNRAAARRQAFLRAAQPQGVQGVQRRGALYGFEELAEIHIAHAAFFRQLRDGQLRVGKVRFHPFHGRGDFALTGAHGA